MAAQKVNVPRSEAAYYRGLCERPCKDGWRVGLELWLRRHGGILGRLGRSMARRGYKRWKRRYGRPSPISRERVAAALMAERRSRERIKDQRMQRIIRAEEGR